METLVLAAAWCTFIGFAVATKLHFAPRPFQMGMKTVSALSIAYLLYLTWVPHMPPSFFASSAGLISIAISAGLFCWSILTTRKARLPLAFDRSVPDRLVTKGPFSLTRNPFYLSYLLCWLGGFIAFPSFVLFWLFLLITAVYLLAIYKEEAALREKFGKEYEMYALQVGRLLPKGFRALEKFHARV